MRGIYDLIEERRGHGATVVVAIQDSQVVHRADTVVRVGGRARCKRSDAGPMTGATSSRNPPPRRRASPCAVRCGHDAWSWTLRHVTASSRRQTADDLHAATGGAFRTVARSSDPLSRVGDHRAREPGSPLSNIANLFMANAIVMCWFTIVAGNVDDGSHDDLVVAVHGSQGRLHALRCRRRRLGGRRTCARGCGHGRRDPGQSRPTTAPSWSSAPGSRCS